MRSILTIIKKEFSRFFKDRRMVITTLILPGLMIYLLYSFMGSAFTDKFTGDNDYVTKAYAVNMPEEFTESFTNLKFEFSSDEISADEIKNKIIKKEADIFIVFPENFISLTPSSTAPNVEIYYNSSSTESQNAYASVVALLDAYESSKANVFDINANAGEIKYDLADEKDVTGMIFSMLMPMLLTLFVFSGAMSVAPESIAGEKERGTIATLLVTPVKRSYLAVGKIISLSVISLLCGISSFIGIILSLPKLAGGEISSNAYVFADYAMLFGIVLSTVLITVSVISVISAFSRSVKEASAYVVPLMIVVMLIGVTGMFGNGAPKSPFLYLIPFYNSVQAMNGIFSFAASAVNIVVTVVSNLVYTVLLAFLLAKMFGSERIMFSK